MKAYYFRYQNITLDGHRSGGVACIQGTVVDVNNTVVFTVMAKTHDRCTRSMLRFVFPSR